MDQILTFDVFNSCFVFSSGPRSEENNKALQTLTSNRLHAASSSVKTALISGNQSTFRTLHFKSLFSNWEQFGCALWAGAVNEWDALLLLTPQPLSLSQSLSPSPPLSFLQYGYYTAASDENNLAWVSVRFHWLVWLLTLPAARPDFHKSTAFMALLSNTQPSTLA